MSFTVGTSGVANFANTHPGTALNVVANAVNGYGKSVGDTTVIIQGTTPSTYFILMESSGYVLQETGSKIQLEN